MAKKIITAKQDEVTVKEVFISKEKMVMGWHRLTR